MSKLKMQNILNNFPQFSDPVCCELYLKDNKHKSIHFTSKIWMLLLGDNLFLEAHSFLRAKFKENCLLLRQIMSTNKYPKLTNY